MVEENLASRFTLTYDISLDQFKISLVTTFNVLAGQFVLGCHDGEYRVFKKVP